jgi:hypothetical protein
LDRMPSLTSRQARPRERLANKKTKARWPRSGKKGGPGVNKKSR